MVFLLSFFLIFFMEFKNCNVFCWNVKGAGCNEFPSLIRDLKLKYRFQILVVIEPHISETSADKVRRKLGFVHNFLVEDEGFGYCLMRDDVFKISIINYDT